MADTGAIVYRKVSLRVVYVLSLLIILSSIDRVNVSFAALQMNADLGLSPQAYGFGVGIFFFAYLLFQLPSSALLKYIGARRWIFLSVTTWGAFATMMAFIHDATHFYVLRFLIGFAESGFAPGVVWYVSQWLPQAYRGRAIGATLLAIPISVIIGGPLSGALLTIEALNWPGWRWMFLVEGAIAFFLGIAALGWFCDGPSHAKWLTPGEKAWIDEALARDHGGRAKTGGEPLSVLIRKPLLWVCAGLWFVLITGANGIIFWLPSAIQSLGDHSDFEIGVLSALPWVAIGAGMILNARHSDLHQERYWHIGLASLLAAAGIGAAALVQGGPLALILLMLGGLGLGGAQGVFWTIPTRFIGSRAPQGIALINLFGNLSGVVAPIAIGWMIQRSGTVVAPALFLAALLLIGAMLLVPLKRLADAATSSLPVEQPA